MGQHSSRLLPDCDSRLFCQKLKVGREVGGGEEHERLNRPASQLAKAPLTTLGYFLYLRMR